MKTTVSIDLDFYEEEGDLKSEIINQIAKSIFQKMGDDTKSKIIEIAKKSGDELTQKFDLEVVARVNAVFDDLNSREIIVTDKWGDVKRRYPSVRDMIKDRFDQMLMERVDADGRSSSYSNTTRIEQMISKTIKSMAECFTQDTIKSVGEEVKKILSENLKKQISDKIISTLDFSAIEKQITLNEKQK